MIRSTSPKLDKLQSPKLEHYVDLSEYDFKLVKGNYYRAFLKDLWKQRNWLIVGTILMLFAVGFGIQEPKLLGRFMNHVSDNPKELYRVLWLYLGMVIARFICLALAQSQFFERLSLRGIHTIRMKLIRHLTAIPYAQWAKIPVGKWITRVTNDTASMQEMFSAGLLTLGIQSMFIIGAIYSMWTLGGSTSLVALSVLPILVVGLGVLTLNLVHRYRISRLKLGEMNAFLSESLNGVRVLQSDNQVNAQVKRFDFANSIYTDSQSQWIDLYSYMLPMMTTAQGLSILFLLANGGPKVRAGEMGIGTLMALLVLLTSLYHPIRELMDRWTLFLSGMSSAERVYQAMAWEPEEKWQSPQTTESLSKIGGVLEAKELTFQYPGSLNYALRGVSFELRPGEHFGVAGPTGSGKSTIAQLLLRFYKPTEGSLWIGGISAESIRLKDWRRLFGIVQQDAPIFKGTLIENLTLFGTLPLPDTNEVKRVLTHLGWKFEMDRVLDERGTNLSTGERQMVSFMRAYFVKPKIWIFDEATAHIDPILEQRVEDLFEHIGADVCRMTIAHRLDTLKRCQSIMVLNEGQVVERGSFAELVGREGLFAKLRRAQLQGLGI